MEAIAQGAIYLNPRFSLPHSRVQTEFFKDKPTNRSLTSQSPYIEKVIGEPYSYLVDMDNLTQVGEVLQRIRSRPQLFFVCLI
ncbi:unnamed protein product [Protopolystoma xenopodis]|uniref:alpha-1,6-mannosyl-glycoprotein 6-beta-N-acetylglucosaminyltransferase n=1 Tax=Protopolystoma xenopodis TaxID=117903 RepID=A0A448WL66_9PLAT|nr:unnamed protein product [Protopolystoma xenopodis]